MWALLGLTTPLSIAGYWIGEILAQQNPGPGFTDTVLAPLGAAVPFAVLALYVIRRQESFIDLLTGELRRVNDETINKFVTAINESTNLHRDATNLHREQIRMWEQVLDELRRSPIR